ncbi:cyclic nucleotide-binding protein [Colwellia sp. 75C3]|uniref:Crp/Fnr family transcriptional regulator n=1 Tax=Colwellia sp. 75C3 TaxID=888425 RepID=UPI000C343450|nr:cyclic nucleotide-binding domain-containing protein [Colwellia sp. 75C3]PKG80866.1 cyclic nucleotide-binding protein [Colwellia sp. 75C3]
MNPKELKTIHEYFIKLNIKNDIISEASPQFKFIKINATDVLLRQGELQQYGYFILSGILRAAHYSNTGSEHCKEYYFKGEMSFLYSAWLTKSPATYQIDALNHSEVIRVPLNLLNLPEWLPAKLELLQQQLLYKEDKEIFLLLKTPEERYLHLLEYAPKWISSLNNIQLATYIGISPISLSRIKNRINNR